jgi:hypothetical protein
MSVASYSALVSACDREPDLALFIRFRLDDIGISRDWPEGREVEEFKNPKPEDVDELIRRVRYEASLRGFQFQWCRKRAARALEVMGL